jgi:hypothetical protein
MESMTHSQSQLQAYVLLQELHKRWTPHPKQVEIGKALFNDGKNSVFVQCGRKFGKTEIATYILWRWAQMYPNSACYYIAPLQTQAKEIIWSDPRLITFGPREWLLDGSQGVNNTEMRLKFKNGSFIKVDGSDNYEKHRGTRPAIIVYEEFKDHRKEFRDVMRPNLAVHQAPEVFIGTPPDDDSPENEFIRTAEEHKVDPVKYFIHAPTWSNPHIPESWLKMEKQRLYARGEGDVWEREYGANVVKGGSNKIFPMLSRDIVRPHNEIVRSLAKDLKKHQWFAVTDPAAASVFGSLFIALNPYTQHIYVLDEIYEREQAKMTVRQIGKRVIDTVEALAPRPRCEWRLIYDEAETWFQNEMQEHFEEALEPTHKALHDKDIGISLLKDVLLAGKITISDKCVHFYWELDNYRKDHTGKIPKKNDHCIAKGELVTTDRGLVPIEYVTTEDKVLTTSGMKRVLRAWRSGTEEVYEVVLSSGHKVRCTSEHKIYTRNRGFVRADALRYADECVIEIPWTELLSMVSSTDVIQALKSVVTDYTTGARRNIGKKLELDICITQSGYHIMGQSKKVSTSTMLTETQRITGSKILGVSQEKSTTESIEQTDQGAGKTILSYSKGSDLWQRCGMGLKMVLHGIGNMAKMCLEVLQGKIKQKESVTVVEKSTLQTHWPRNVAQGSAQITASQHTDGSQESITKRERANRVRLGTQLINTQEVDTVLVRAEFVALKKTGEIKPVYDLTVHGKPEFFVGGILVHNCLDCFRYFLGATMYSLREVEEVIPEKDENYRPRSMESELREWRDSDASDFLLD